MSNRTLSLRSLNRTLLARQMLLAREAITVTEAVERLVGLQAQIPNPPYIGLWTRLQAFRRDDLTRMMMERQIVRAAMMRSTLHLVTAADHQCFRPLIEPALIKALAAFFGTRGKALDIAALVAAAKAALDEKPCSTGELKARLLEVAPGRDGDALAYAVRTYLPLVQVPPGGTWGSGSFASYVTAEAWLGALTPVSLETLFARYLRAFGPASVMDFQAWSGRVNLKSEVAAFAANFATYESENGTLLYDVPGMPIVDADTPAPLRFVPEYDNLIIAHADRTRIISDAARKRVFLSAARVLPTILVDGFVAGTWKVERTKADAVLTIQPFARLTDAQKAELVEEGERLITFMEDDAATYAVRLAAV